MIRIRENNILREQLKLIREELGEDNTADDAEEFKKKLQELQAGDEVKEKISKEIERFKNTNSNVSENAVLRGYIETCLHFRGRRNPQILMI